MKKSTIIVIGNGMVGHKFIEYLAAQAGPNVNIITFSEEPMLAYDRVQLSSYFEGNSGNSEGNSGNSEGNSEGKSEGNSSGKSADDLALTTPAKYDDLGVKYHLNDKVVEIDRDRQRVVTEKGVELAYDKLVLATGSTPFVPPVTGNQGEFIHVYRTLQDLDDIKASAANGQSGVVIGGGLLGLEAANALKQLNLDTSVVEFAAQLMPVQLDKNGGKLLRQKIEDLGVTVLTEKNTRQIVAGRERRYRLEFADGSDIETDVIVFSAGIRPQDELARSSALEIGERGGIVIDDHCQTSDKNIYAIGECALWQGRIFGLVAPGYQMAKVAAAAVAGDPSDNGFTGADMSTKLKLLGVDVASIGDPHGKTAGSQSYSFTDEHTGVYKKVVISNDGQNLLGAVLVGDAQDYGNWLQLYLNKMALPQPAEQLLFPFEGEVGSAAMGVDSLPDSAQICSCNDVSKGDIIACVDAGHHDLPSVKSACNAGTGCGGCSQLVGQIMDCQLSKMGFEVNNHICEHFEYSRAELFDIVRIKQIKTFAKLIVEHGHGTTGCEICKPAVGSILASLWNQSILDKPHVILQDTNDAFLANMQKDGTYSVVPRIPGGEITPEKLIVIGQVAQEFSLYTKITGGQRIDLFGAQLHQLPLIWQQLVDAGFETGHAYGKALRTVKSCVGTNWCRYGVQDSTGMAIVLEQRYRGIRSPHKIKMAVSGCARECAEAQSKDFGVIATENGWNLYVGGNGGMRPRHAELFATDIDDQTLISYIDRIMVFYIRTADRLQRTSVWMESMEGGLDYLKAVVIDNKLALNDELEAQMDLLVDSYQCEWKATIEDEEKLQRFQHFVNSEKPDPKVIFTTERGQIKPAVEEAVLA